MSRTKRRNQRRNPFSVPLAASLFLSSALVVLAVGAGLAALLLQARVLGVESRADDLLGRSVERLRLQTSGISDQATRALGLSRDLLAALPADARHPDTLRATLAPVLTHFPALAGLRVSGPQGLRWVIYPDGDSWLTRRETDTGTVWERWLRKDGQLLNSEGDAAFDDTRMASVAEAAERALHERSDGNLGLSPAVLWSEASRLERTQGPGMTAALAFETPPSESWLVSVDSDWRALADDSSRIYDVRPEHTLIATEGGTLLATPRRVNPATADALALPRLDSIANHPLSEAMRRFATDTYPPSEAFAQQSDGANWWFSVEPFKLGQNQTLYLCAGVTEAHLLSQERGQQIALAIGMVTALVLAALFALLYARALSAPLKDFLRRTRRIDFLTRSAALRPKSRVREFDQLYAALDDLCEAVIQQLEARDIPMVVHAAPVKKRAAEEAAEAVALGTTSPEVESWPAPAGEGDVYVPEAYIQALQATRRQLRQAKQHNEDARQLVAKAEKSIEARELRWKTARESAREIARIATQGTQQDGDTLNNFAQSIAQGMAVAAAGIWLRDADTRQFHCAARFDRLRNAFIPGPDLNPAEHVVLFGSIEALPFLGVPDFQSDPRTSTLLPLWPGELLPEPMLIAPWFRDGSLTGFVLIEDANGARHWDPAEESLALLAAASVARVLEIGRTPPPPPAEPAEDELEESPEDEYRESPVYRQLLDSTRGIVWAVNAEGRIVFVNPAAEMRYEAIAPEMIGRPLSDFAASGSAENDRAQLDLVLRGEARVDSVTEHVSATGKTLHLHLTWAPLEDEDGEVVGAVVLATDIADIQDRRSQTNSADARYRSIMESLHGVLFSVDSRGRIEYVSPGVQALYGFGPEELRGLPMAAVADETQGPRDLEALEQLMQGRPCAGYHAVHRRKDGGEARVTAYAQATQNDEGEPDGAVGVVFARP
ncbi:MAG: PAS domain S-box protein [Candidatus Hydrogenedens sp.]|nr:PAS domain S-box protein [Candidatus Hydrogenedens sp.]